MTAIITLLTDFGLRDAYVGEMKGVILGIAPDARLVDITHLIAPQDVAEAAVVFNRSAPHFPEGTVHICVVDPGVGTARRPVAARLGAQFFVGPDNGLLTHWLLRARRDRRPVDVVHLDRPEYWRREVSGTFHGRDIFAPVAAHLAGGVSLFDVGSPIDDPVLLPVAPLQKTAHGLRGTILHIDHFGNIATDIRAEDIAGLGEVIVRAGEVEARGLARAFGDRAPGELMAYVNSHGELGLAVVNGDAARRLGARVGDAVEVVRISF